MTEDFVKCEGCDAEAVTMDNPDGVYLCQGCYDVCEEDSVVEQQEAAREAAQKANARRTNVVTTIVVLAIASLLALTIYKESEKAPFMRIEKILEQPKDK